MADTVKFRAESRDDAVMTTLPATFNVTLSDCDSMNLSDCYNMTEPIPTKDPVLYTAYSVIMSCITAWIMFSMGSGIKLKIVKERLKRPVGPIIGLLCQCFLFPALMYAYTSILPVEDNIGIGMIITASSPGGAVSNMFTFWSRADLDLSVTMTTISTLLAIGFMPLNMYIYVRTWIRVEDIPFVDMVIAILVVWAAVLLGGVVGWKFPKAVPWLTRLGSILGFVLILCAGIVQAALFPEVFNLDWYIYFAAITMPYIGFLIGFFVSWIFCFALPQRTAIAYEVGLQNVTLAITVITVSVPNFEQASHLSQYSILYGTFQIVSGVILSIIYQLVYRLREKQMPCHIYSRWKQNKDRFEEENGLKAVTTNGTTFENTSTNEAPDSVFKMAYSGSALELKQVDESENAGSGNVPDGRVSSTTQLFDAQGSDISVDTANGVVHRMESVDSQTSNGGINISISESERL